MRPALISKSDLFKKVPELKAVDLNLCISCKAVKNACGLPKCPLLKIYEIPELDNKKIESISFDKSLFGPSSMVFIGHRGYPSIFSGPLTSLEPDAEFSKLGSDPSQWTSLSINEILKLRFGLLRGKTLLPAQIVKKGGKNVRFLSEIQEIAMATNQVETESSYKHKIKPNLKFDSILSPQGPSGFMKSFEITGHSRIPGIVERTLDDELNANEQISILSQRGISQYYLQNIFSSGLTGLSDKSKLVPTKWSITALDDIIGKDLITKLENFPVISEIRVLSGGFFGNYFTIILYPEPWKFENFETWMKGSIFRIGQKTYKIVPDHEGVSIKENYKGKIQYSVQGGGYYAARISILKYLNKIKRQAKVISIREINSEYLVPSGVWVVREAARLATEAKPKHFTDEKQLNEYLNNTLEAPLKDYYKSSTILAQSSLHKFYS